MLLLFLKYFNNYEPVRLKEESRSYVSTLQMARQSTKE